MAEDYFELSWRRQDEQNRNRQVDLVKIEHDVQVARQIQINFLPNNIPQPEGWDIAAAFQPARQVAGDWYDAFYLSNNRRVGFALGDVCDKGVGSALFMALFRSLLRSFSQQNLALRWMDSSSSDWLSSDVNSRRKALPSTGTSAIKSAVEITNNYIVENHSDMGYFATLFMGAFDPSNGTFSYVNGGHPPMVIIDANGTVKNRLKPTGPAVGIFAEADFNMGQATLEPGDCLFIFSDGATDARSPAGVLFSEKCLLELLVNPPDTASGLLSRVMDTLKTYIDTAPQFDDITLMVIKRKNELKE
jgi:sigma-B regulation protein RsbU (phosphoserine phosphatase)